MTLIVEYGGRTTQKMEDNHGNKIEEGGQRREG